MENNMKVFENKEFGFVRTVMVGNEPWYSKKSNAGLFVVRDYYRRGHFGTYTLITPSGKNLFRMQDDIARHYPEKIENYKQVIAGLKKDNNTAVSSPHPTDGFCGMKVNGSFYADKEEAGRAILDSCKSVTGAEPVTIGSYRGFSMAMSVEDFGRQFVLTLRGEMSHRVELGKDVRGNIVRIDNALSQIPARIQAAQAQLENVRNQLETAKAEVNKPFPKEDELKTKSARLSELNAELNIDERRSTLGLPSNGTGVS